MTVLTVLSALAAHGATGGPDAFGYRFIDSNEPGGPAYAFDDISATGAWLSGASGSDDSHEVIPVAGFSFPFYGVNRTVFAVGTNGAVYFEDVYLGLTNTCVPATNSYGVDTFVALFWDDLNPGSAGDVYWQLKGTAGVDQRLIVQFDGVVRYGTSDPITAQVVLWESGVIDLAYASVVAGTDSATVGIQGDPLTGLQVSCDAAGAVAGGLLIRFSASDADGDGFLSVADGGTDCDDNDATTYPGAPELCDGLDNDCDGALPVDESDGDGDGVALCAGDCDDADPAAYPGGQEVCDGADNDCDGALPPAEADADLDGVMSCEGDCDDADIDNFPGNTELCDGVDNDCDGSPGPDEADQDQDGHRVCDGDCDDQDPTVFPGALDQEGDGVDQDCDGTDGPGSATGTGTGGTGTGGTGTGGTGTGAATGGATGTGTGSPGTGEYARLGCGCSHGGAGAGWLGGLALLLARRREP